jgi:RecA/RadA recombinase
MAKAKKEVKKFQFSEVGKILDNLTKTVSIVIEKEKKEKSYISTGIYLLDCAISGKLLGGGVLAQRTFLLGGESGVGKSYISYSICRQAQKVGYSVIYIDTEFSIDLEDLENVGLDISDDMLRLVRASKVEDVNVTVTTILDELKNQKLAGFELPKIMFVLDSIGQLASNKEMKDILSAELKDSNFTKAKALNSMYRSINNDLGMLEMPFITVGHTYESIGQKYPVIKIKGGNAAFYAASVVGILSKAQMEKTGEEDEMDINSGGIVVTFKTIKNRLSKPKKIKFNINFNGPLNPYDGLEVFCRPENFETVGIAKGVMQIDKETGEATFKAGGNKWYVRHLGKHVAFKNLKSPTVFTQQVLESLEPITNEYFRYKSAADLEESEKEFNKIVGDDEDDEESDGFEDVDSLDGGDFFGK